MDDKIKAQTGEATYLKPLGRGRIGVLWDLKACAL